MHSVYATPGFVVDSKPYGEADKLLSIFTRDLGMVLASARGIRLERSKLRYFCQDGSFGDFALVRGKEFWRLTGAQRTTSAGLERPAAELLVRMATLLKRLVQGEEPHPDLFDCLESVRKFLSENRGVDGEALNALESLSVLRVLSLLGYVGKDAATAGFISSFDISLGLLSDAARHRKSMNAHINKALRESHL